MANEVIAIDLIEIHYSRAALAAAGIEGDSFRVSTSREDIEWQGNTYKGAGSVISLTSLAAAKGSAPEPLRLTISGIPETHRRFFARDPGVVDVSVQKIISRDGGATYQALRGVWRGTLSRTIAQGAEVVAELEVRQDADIDRGYPKYWSPQDAAPGDKGFEHVHALEQGLGEQKWPP